MSNTESKNSIKWMLVVLATLALVVGVSFVSSEQQKAKVSDFVSCKAAGGMILETYPEQCTSNGSSYTNESQTAPVPPQSAVDGSTYIGLSESDALAKAEKENVPARVVEREGEGLPVTMDFVFGRLNLYIKDGLVYKVEVEGETTDTPKN